MAGMDGGGGEGGVSLTEVSSPGGIATDNFSVFWTNKAFGTAQGSMRSGNATEARGRALSPNLATLPN